jgi:hypothetical protein
MSDTDFSTSPGGGALAVGSSARSLTMLISANSLAALIR